MDETSGFDITESSKYDNENHILRLVHESERGFCRILEVKHAGRLFIAKTLKNEFKGSKVHLNLLKKEDEILSTLYHPSIIQTFGIHEVEGEGPCLILEYAHGVTLQTYIDSGEITSGTATLILEQICSAIDYCHQRGIIHRDLKPSNIMVYPHGPIVKLIDFNFSHSPSYTDYPIPGGTTNFSAPEQFEPGNPALPSSDIWSIGKIMEELLPNGGRKWRRVAKLCLADSPADRPSNAKLILKLLKKKLFPTKRSIGFVIVIIALFCGLFFLFLNNDQKEMEKSAGASVESVSDSINPYAERNVDKDIFNSELSEATEDNDINEIGIIAPPAESSKIQKGDDDKGNDIKEQDAILSASLISEAKKRAEKTAARRFKEQLSILDTAEHSYTIALAKVKHWRWLAKQDMSKWIKTQKLTEAEEKELTETVSNRINEYDKEHHNELKKALEDALINRHVVWVWNPPETLWQEIGNDEYERKVLGEDGVLRIERKKGKHQD